MLQRLRLWWRVWRTWGVSPWQYEAEVRALRRWQVGAGVRAVRCWREGR